MIIGGIAWVLTKEYFEEKEVHAWVECKNQLSTVKRQQMQKLISSAEDVKAHPDAKWKPDVLMYVSATGFDADALNFAMEYSIECYVPKENGRGFEQVDY